jgi:zona occludens toxin
MSITLVTGVPGSGKSLYAVWNLVRPMVGQTVTKVYDDNVVETLERKVFTNINGLLLEHELIEGGGKWTKNKDDTWEYEGNEHGLRNWHNWAKPGSYLVFDEFQKMWPPRPNGAAIPPDIQTLDTHRHMGVDFVLICQNVNNIDRHVVGLVDRHLHVRRVANMPFATVYEWDHCSRSLLYKNAMSKIPFRYPAAAYKLYKSAEVHTKQRRKLPFVLWFILAGVAGVAYAVPTLTDRISSRINPAKTVQTATEPTPKDAPQTYVKDGMRYTVQTTSTSAPPLAPASAPAEPPPEPQISGCVVSSLGDCRCFDAQGGKVKASADYCPDPAAKKPVHNLSGIHDTPQQVPPMTPQELQSIRLVFGVKSLPHSTY